MLFRSDRISASNPEGLQKILDGLSGRAKSIVQALFNEVQSLQKQNQGLMQDLKSGITKAHLDATTKAHNTEVVSETKLKESAMDYRKAIAVAEIHAGASLLNTRAEAKHHQEEAERMIQEAANTERINP